MHRINNVSIILVIL